MIIGIIADREINDSVLQNVTFPKFTRDYNTWVKKKVLVMQGKDNEISHLYPDGKKVSGNVSRWRNTEKSVRFLEHNLDNSNLALLYKNMVTDFNKGLLVSDINFFSDKKASSHLARYNKGGTDYMFAFEDINILKDAVSNIINTLVVYKNSKFDLSKHTKIFDNSYLDTLYCFAQYVVNERDKEYLEYFDKCKDMPDFNIDEKDIDRDYSVFIDFDKVCFTSTISKENLLKYSESYLKQIDSNMSVNDFINLLYTPKNERA